MLAVTSQHQNFLNMVPFNSSIEVYNLKKCVATVEFFDGNRHEFRGFCLINKLYLIDFYNTIKIYPPVLPFLNFYFQVFKPGPAATLLNFYQLRNDYSVEYDEQYHIKNLDISIDSYFYPEIYLNNDNIEHEVLLVKEAIKNYTSN